LEAETSKKERLNAAVEFMTVGGRAKSTKILDMLAKRRMLRR
jgi:hypothetical protein